MPAQPVRPETPGATTPATTTGAPKPRCRSCSVRRNAGRTPPQRSVGGLRPARPREQTRRRPRQVRSVALSEPPGYGGPRVKPGLCGYVRTCVLGCHHGGAASALVEPVLPRVLRERARVGTRQDHRGLDAVRLSPRACRPDCRTSRARGCALRNARLPVGLVQATARAGDLAAPQRLGHGTRRRSGISASSQAPSQGCALA